jgi:hypothetical protein
MNTAQPFFVINDDGYDRMMKTLRDGAKTVKSYLGTCPHKNKNKCKCVYWENYLNEDGKMVRNVNGVIKPVLSFTMLMNIIG